MLRFLFGAKPQDDPKPETQREAFERLTTELTALLDSLPEKPVMTVDMQSGTMRFQPPEQFPDEALALPAPAAVETAATESATEPMDEKAA